MREHIEILAVALARTLRRGRRTEPRRRRPRVARGTYVPVQRDPAGRLAH